MKDIYELYKNSIVGYKKTALEEIDKQILELEKIFANEDWFLVNGGFDGMEYLDGTDVCRIPFIKNVGLYPTRKEKNQPTFAELQALSFYVRNKQQIEKLSDTLLKKYKMIVESSKDSLGREQDIANILLSKEQPQKNIQKVK